MTGAQTHPARFQVSLTVADDTRRAALTRGLGQAGLAVVVAVASHEDRPPDAILADWPLPVGARVLSAFGQTPWVAMVDRGDGDSATAALVAGASDFVWSDSDPADVAVRLRVSRERRSASARAADTPVSPLEDMLEALPSGVAVLSADGTVVQVNARMCEISGSERAGLVGLRATHDALLGGDVARIEGLLTRAARDGVATDSFLAGPGTVLSAHLTAGLDDVGRPTGYVLSVRPHNVRERVADSLARLAGASRGPGDDLCPVIAREALELAGGVCAVVAREEDDMVTVVARAGSGAPREGERLRGADARRAVDAMLKATHPGAEVVSAGLQVAGGVWGRVAVCGDPERLASARRGLERFCQVAGIALAGHVALPAPADACDPLTGLLANRGFFGRLQREFLRAREDGTDLSLVLVDLDQFKRVNDNHGHVEGDRVLAEVAGRLRAVAAPDHVLGRLGGEEFGWIMPGTSIEEAFDLARTARQSVVDAGFGAVGKVTATLGVSELKRSQGETIDELRQQAEVALHWAKISGGNRCVSYSFTLAEQVFARKAALTAEGPSLRGMRALAWAVDARDPHTQRHSIRVADLAVQIAVALGWTTERATQLREAGLVHDVGKIAVPDRILFKPTRLTPEEFALVTRHPVVGAQIVADVLSAEQAAWVRGHHERWDGAGYPDGLAGDAIPEEARVLALADSWDVMTSVRSYKGPVDLRGAVAEITRCSGTQFWPEAVNALLRLVASGAVGARGVVRPIGDVVADAQTLAA